MKRKKLKLAEATSMDMGLKPNLIETGSSGTEISGGVYSEEFLSDLQGSKGADTFDKMRRREATVSMLLDAMLNPIIAGNWSFEIDDEADTTQVKMKELCEWNFRRGIIGGLKQHLREALTLAVFGYSVFELVNASEKVAALDGQLVTFFKKFAFRKQNSISKWNLERKTGRLLSVEQQSSTDVSKTDTAVIPGEFLLVFTNKKEGDNFEGISALRPMFGAYSRKDLYLKLAAMGVEQNARGVVVGKTPANKTNSDEDKNFESVLQAYAEGLVSYIKIPAGWEVTVQQGTFDAAKMVALLNFENEEMARAVVAAFLMLGAGGGGGSYSLGSDLSDFFLGGIQAYADIVSEGHNQLTIPRLCEMNYGPQKSYPQMKCTGINDKAGLEFAQIMAALIGKGIKADDKLEDFLRLQYKLPKADPATAREPAPTLPGQDPNADPEKEEDVKPTPPVKKKLAEQRQANKIHFAEGYKTQFNNAKAELRDIMKGNLRVMADDLKAKIAKNYKALSDAQKINAGKDVTVKQSLISDYNSELRASLASISTMAIAQARKEAPKAAQKVKFGDYEKLNPLVKRQIEAALKLTTKTQAEDLEKMVLFQFNSSSSQTDLDAILNDIEGKIAPMLEGETNAGIALDVSATNLTANVVQNSRNSFFFAPEVLETIESFTFYNEDPQSDICINLNGQTFLATDPNAEQFYPPLHHNCKSRLQPNEPGEKKVTGIGPIAETVEEREALMRQITFCDHVH